MKKILCGLALMFVAMSAQAVTFSQPLDKNDYVERDRFETVRTSGFVDFIITDKKTGCQFMWISGQLEALGCFDDYKDKK